GATSGACTSADAPDRRQQRPGGRRSQPAGNRAAPRRGEAGDRPGGDASVLRTGCHRARRRSGRHLVRIASCDRRGVAMTRRWPQVAPDDVTAEIRAMADPLHTSEDLDALVERLGDARYVLLGEASHGTHDYYAWRAELSRRLITEQGFTFVAVEGDWPDCYAVNRWLKGRADSDRSA